MSAESMFTPADLTPEQWEQGAVVQGEVLELLKRLVRDGFDYRIVSVGTSTALASMIGNICGPEQVPVHFARLAAHTMHLAQPPAG